jgi:hypothetical protein
MCDAVRNDARLPAARSGKNQQRSVDVVYGFTLLRIKPFEEIHERGTFYFTMPCAAGCLFQWDKALPCPSGRSPDS